MATSEQNEAIGKFKLLQLEKKMNLLKTAQGPRSKIGAVVMGLSIPIIVLVANKVFSSSYEMLLLLSLLPIISFISFDASRANSRLDALIQLIGDENLLRD